MSQPIKVDFLLNCAIIMSLLTNVEAELGCDNFPSVAFCLAWPMLKPNTKFALNGPLTETSNHPE